MNAVPSADAKGSGVFFRSAACSHPTVLEQLADLKKTPDPVTQHESQSLILLKTESPMQISITYCMQ